MLVRVVVLTAGLLLPRIVAAQSADPEPVDDRYVRVVSHVPPVYPQIAVSARIQGVIVVAVTFDAAGAVTKTTILSGMPLIREAAAASVARWTFAPSRQGRAIVVADFRMTSECADTEPAPAPVLRPPNMITVYACTPIAQP